MCAVSLQAIREAIDTCAESDTATFARQTRNAIARAIVAEAMAHEAPAAAEHPPPDLRPVVGPELADTLAALYAGGDDWTSRAIDALEPLHALARR